MRVRVQVSTLGVDVPKSNFRADSNIRKSVGHAAAAKRVLKLGAHESISLTRVGENEEVNAEHGHVEDDGDEDEADRASDEMPDKEPRRDTEVTKKIPELLESAKSNGSDGEKADPLATDDGTKGETSHNEPYPPSLSERLVVILIAEGSPGKGCEGGEEDEGRIEKDMTRLGDHAILEGDQQGSQKGGGNSTVECAKSEVGQGDSCNTHEGGDHAHRDIRHILVHPEMTSVEYSDQEEE